MSDAPVPKQTLLQELNSAFAEHNLPLWSEANLGDRMHGECEITRIRDIASAGPSRVRVTFDFLTPDGGDHSTTVGFGGEISYVIPVLTLPESEGSGVPRVCLCKRWRVEQGRWTYQVPHALGEQAPNAADRLDAFASPAHRVLARTFGDEFVAALSAARVTPVGQMMLRRENPPASAYILAANVLIPFRRRKGDGAPVLLTWPEILKLLDEGNVITDVFTVAVLLKAARKFAIPGAKSA